MPDCNKVAAALKAIIPADDYKPWSVPCGNDEEYDYKQLLQDALSLIEQKRESRRRLPCVCGCKYPTLWFNATYGTNYYKCDRCGLKSPESETDIGAIREWNNMIINAENEVKTV